jgi:hypothetical protein
VVAQDGVDAEPRLEAREELGERLHVPGVPLQIVAGEDDQIRPAPVRELEAVLDERTRHRAAQVEIGELDDAEALDRAGQIHDGHAVLVDLDRVRREEAGVGADARKRADERHVEQAVDDGLVGEPGLEAVVAQPGVAPHREHVRLVRLAVPVGVSRIHAPPRLASAG